MARQRADSVSNREIADALRKSHGTATIAARSLGIGLTTINRRLAKHVHLRRIRREAARHIQERAELTLIDLAFGNRAEGREPNLRALVNLINLGHRGNAIDNALSEELARAIEDIGRDPDETVAELITMIRSMPRKQQQPQLGKGEESNGRHAED